MDPALVEAARTGDEEAFASIARGMADRLFAVAHRILRDVGRAEDAAHVGRSSVTPATEHWDPPQPLKDDHGAPRPVFDIVATGYGAVFQGTSTVVPAGVSLDEWIDRSVASAASTTTCMVPRARQAEITIDGRPARISEGCAGQFVATVVAGGRLYVFELLHGGDREAWARTFFDAWLATIRLTPETAAPASSASQSR